MTDKFIAEMQKRADKKRFTEGLIRIQKNQQTIYDKLASSIDGIEKEHAEMLRNLLADYQKVFDMKIGLVNRHDNELIQLTTQLQSKISAYNQHIKTLRKTIKEADTARKFFDFEAKRLNKTILEYNQKVTELNELLLKVREGGETDG